MKLTIELIPKGAWGNNLRELLPPKDWDKLRELCYVRAGNQCSICGRKDVQLHAHEVWDFDYDTQTQTLRDIVALCPACHGVKHFRNSERIGYGEQAKAHFMEVNRCGELAFASYCTQVKATYDKMNEILRWKVVADLKPFGGKEMNLKECKTPIIVNPYENMSFPLFCGTRKPGLCSVKVDNYSGEITVVPDETYKVRWVADGKIIKTHFKYTYPFVSTLCVKDMCAESLRFHLIGKAEEYISEKIYFDECLVGSSHYEKSQNIFFVVASHSDVEIASLFYIQE